MVGEEYGADAAAEHVVRGAVHRVDDCLARQAGAVVVDRAGRPDPMPAGGLLVVRPEVCREVLGLWSG